jgi:hypothetical protein
MGRPIIRRFFCERPYLPSAASGALRQDSWLSLHEPLATALLLHGACFRQCDNRQRGKPLRPLDSGPGPREKQ